LWKILKNMLYFLKPQVRVIVMEGRDNGKWKILLKKVGVLFVFGFPSSLYELRRDRQDDRINLF